MEQKTLEKPNLLHRIWMFTKNHSNTLVSLNLSVVSLMMFLIVGYPDMLPEFVNLSQRWLGLITLGVYMFVSFVSCLFTRWKWKRKISVWIQTNLLFIFSILYYLRLNSESYNLAGISIDSSAVLGVLGILIFLINRRLFRRSFLKEWLLIGEVILISLTSFSLVSLLELNQSVAVDNAVLGFVFGLPQLVWIGFAAISLGVVSSLNTGTTKSRDVYLFASGFSLVFFQLMLVLNYLNLTYWYKSLLLLVIWDFAHSTSKAVVLEETSLNFYPKLIISTIYHIVLFAVVFYFSNIINF